MEIFFKFIIIIPLILSIRVALSLKDRSNVKRAIDFMSIGAIIAVIAELSKQDSSVVKVIGVVIFFYGIGIVTYYKFLEGLREVD